jgi:Spy/CpxP family protein refolding chaperone
MTTIQRKSTMKITRHRVTAALFAASFATFAASPAFAAGQADAPPAAAQQEPGGQESGGPGAFGEHGPGMHGHGMPFDEMHGDMMMRFHHLNLSEAQRDKLFSIMHAAAPEHREHMKAIRKAHEALAELVRADHFDDARAGALSRELGQAIAAQALLQARTAAQAMAVLSPEQREQLRRHRTPGPQVRPRAPQDMPDAQAPQRRP